MCGIVGYAGRQPLIPILMDGLRHLEYRGYDSAGVAVVTTGGALEVRKSVGRLDRLAQELERGAPQGEVGIAHTRWATHGAPSDENAHPHTDCTGRVCVVHNGVIENYADLRAELTREGHHFRSETDTEVIAHLIERELAKDVPHPSEGRENPALTLTLSQRERGQLGTSPLPLGEAGERSETGEGRPPLSLWERPRSAATTGEGVAATPGSIEVAGTPSPQPSPGGRGGSSTRANSSRLAEAIRRALAHLEGQWAVGVVSLDEPDVVIGARHRMSLIVALSDDGNFLASDVPAVLGETRRVLRIKEDDVAEIRADGVSVFDRLGRPQTREVEEITWDVAAAEKGGYPHFFLKELYEQPEALTRTLAGRIENGQVVLPELDGIEVDRIRRVLITGCGSAFHAGMMARYAFESWLRVPVEVDIASELRYRKPIVDDGVLCVAVSQSGETADTLAAFELARDMGAQRIAVTNVVGSALTQLADQVVYQHSGPEIAVVASKSFTGQVATLLLVGLALAEKMGNVDRSELAPVIAGMAKIPECVKVALETQPDAARIAERQAYVDKLLFLGRGVGYPTALEGALKLKEISYIQAEGYPAGELKHGPLALVEPGSLVIVLATRSETLEKLISNVEEVRARGGRIIAIASQGDDRIDAHADEVIRVPEVPELISPIVNVIPMQLLAYHAAIARGCDVDKPRNLAKSVTVE
jgi:glutamine---fructose-6-phosphate transaminase (isomerizing)